jgi:hypothetical protein
MPRQNIWHTLPSYILCHLGTEGHILDTFWRLPLLLNFAWTALPNGDLLIDGGNTWSAAASSTSDSTFSPTFPVQPHVDQAPTFLNSKQLVYSPVSESYFLGVNEQAWVCDNDT